MKELVQEKPKGRGKPPETMEPLSVRMPSSFIAKLDNWRRVQPDLPNRPEAVRRILEKALGK